MAKKLKISLTGCPKSAVRWCKQKFLTKGVSATKSWKKSRNFLGIGLLTIILVKGKKPIGGVGGVDSTPPGPYRVNHT